MEEKLSGIVLGGVNYGENDKILSVFTIDKGVVSARIKGVKKAGAKLKFASEPFCFAEFVFSEKLGKRTVTGASLIDSFYPLREDIIKYYAGAVILEFDKRFLKEEIISPDLFILSVESLKELAYGKISPVITAANFLINALKYSGYALNFDGCSVCHENITGKAFFDYRFGAFLCENCHKDSGREINLSTYVALKNISEGVSPDIDDAVRGLKLLDYYLSNKCEEDSASLKELIRMLKNK